MFRKYPYWGWLLVSLALWCFNALHFHTHRLEMLPERMAESVNIDLHQKQSDFNKLFGDTALVSRIVSGTFSEKESDKLNTSQFFVYVYCNDTLKYWNTNKVIGIYYDSLQGRHFLVHNEKGVFVEQCQKLQCIQGNCKLVVLYPVFITYPLENDYLKSHFVASDFIPTATKMLADSAQPWSYPVSLLGGKNIFYLHFNQADLQKWVPDPLFLVMLVVNVLTSVFWIQLIILYYTRNKSSKIGLLLTCSVILVIKVLLYWFRLPFNLGVLVFFSPKLFSFSWLVPSLGDLFIDILLLLWVIVFVTRNTPYKTYFSKLFTPWKRWAFTTLLLVFLVAYSFLFANITMGLVLGQGISFDVSHFYAINIYTILGLLAIGALTGVTCMVIYLCNVQFSSLLPNKKLKYLLLAITGCVLLLCFGPGLAGVTDVFSWLLVGWLVLFVVLLDIRNFTLVSDLFEPHMIFWAVFICGFCTGVITYFNQLKEKQERKLFVEQRLSPHRDTLMENVFDKTAVLIMKDKVLKGFFHSPSVYGRKSINQRFESQYLTGAMNQFQSRVYIFDEKGEALYNKDTTDFSFLQEQQIESATTNSEYLFYKESILDRRYYMSFIPVFEDSSSQLLGYIIIDLDLKKRVTETVYPELLQPIANKANAADNEYAYAVYINDKLITQTNDYPFTVTLTNDSLKEQQYAFYENNGITELYYKIADKRTVVVVHYHSELIEAITLFSYLFGIQVVLAIIVLLYRLFISYFTGLLFKMRFLNLRRRVHFSMLAVILVSFIIIGSVTILFFTREYKGANSNKLQSAMQVVKQSVQDYLKRENAFAADYVFDSISRSTRFKYFISGIANNQKIDINIYDDRGNLFSASQDDIYEKGLISRKIRPDAYYRLNNEGKSLVIQDEKVIQD